MKKLFLISTLLLLLAGCSVVQNKAVVQESKSNIESKTVNQIIVDSGVFNNNIYHPDKDIAVLEAARGRQLVTPDDYELAIETRYALEGGLNYNIKIYRQLNKSNETYHSLDQRMPEKPLVVAITKPDNTILNLFLIRGYSVLSGSMGWDDYDLAKIAKSIEIKDLDGDGINEIIIYTFKGYTADSEYGMVTIYFIPEESLFAVADKIFRTTWKDAYRLTEINNETYVLEANSGSGNCRVCPTPYLVRIYKYTGDYFFDVGSVGVEKEFEEGREALDYALSRIKEKILTGDIFTL